MNDREKLVIALNQFTTDCLAKFDKGREEHGDDLSKLDCDAEIYSEITDIVNYLMIKKFF